MGDSADRRDIIEKDPDRFRYYRSGLLRREGVRRIMNSDPGLSYVDTKILFCHVSVSLLTTMAYNIYIFMVMRDTCIMSL